MKPSKKKFIVAKNSNNNGAAQSEAIQLTKETTGILTIYIQGKLKTPWYRSEDGQSKYHECKKVIPITNAQLMACTEDGSKPKKYNGNWKSTGKKARILAAMAEMAESEIGYIKHNFQFVA